jgi:hypothetical protein
MKPEALFLLLTKMALVENPNLNDGTDKNRAYLDGMREMTGIYVEVGKAGLLVSPEVDPLLLASIGYEESRHKPKVKDGDCHFLVPPNEKCNAFGPMQLAKSAPALLARIDEPHWKGVTLQAMYDPLVNVQGAYRFLQYWKSECGTTPASWLGSYGSGKCHKKPIAMAVRRCTIARALGNELGVKVEGCPADSNSDHTKRLQKALTKKGE